MDKDKKNVKTFEDFGIEETKFMNLLHTTEKYKELYAWKSLEVKMAIIGSIITCVILSFVVKLNTNGFIEISKNLCLYIGSALIGLLGFVIAGLSILTGTLGVNIAKKINEDKKAHNIVGIFFSFHFIGIIIGIQIVLYFISYLLLFTPLELNIYLAIILSFILSYLFVFSIFYSIGLLGTCLRMFLINYRYNDK